ncbi:MAG TPA: WYL domain-containing protein [Roseimicrobium sp.]|nr:WYL domain-containing protein [Roseimicrobium sp.]
MLHLGSLIPGLAVGSDVLSVAQPKIIGDIPPWPLIPPDELEFWQSLPRIPVTQTTDPDLSWVINAVRRRERIHFRYNGGSTPGEPRVVSPSLVFTVDSLPHYYYTMGYCHVRGEERVFRVDRMDPWIF